MKASWLGDAKTFHQPLSCHEQVGDLEVLCRNFILESAHNHVDHIHFFSWFLQRDLIFRLRFCESWLITGSLQGLERLHEKRSQADEERQREGRKTIPLNHQHKGSLSLSKQSFIAPVSPRDQE